MRKPNCISDFVSERDSFLLSRVKAAFSSMDVINVRRACSKAASDPAPRFWVNEGRAALILRRMMRGETLAEKMIPEKGRMYRHLLEKVMQGIEKNPGAEFSQIVTDAVNSEAPCSFISPERLRKVIYAERARMRGKGRQG